MPKSPLYRLALAAAASAFLAGAAYAQSSDPAAIVQLLTWSANAVQQMTASLKGQFAPA